MIQAVHTIDDVAVFMNNIFEEGVNAHPDELFENYVNIKTGQPTYSTDDAAKRNILMEKSFDVCEKEGVDIYDMMQEIFLKNTVTDI